MGRDRFLVVALREVSRPRVPDENEIARQVDVAPLKTRQLALAQTGVDGGGIEWSPERLDLQQCCDGLMCFEEGGLPLRFPAPAHALGRIHAAPFLDADGRRLYLAAIVDLYARRVVGWATSNRIDTKLCLAALAKALRARQPAPGLIHHSDRGSQYASRDYRAALEAHGVRASMSRKGECFDNAVAESFWSTLKAELVELTSFQTRDEARRATVEYIEVFYNRRRIHSALAYRTPVGHEELFNHAAIAA